MDYIAAIKHSVVVKFMELLIFVVHLGLGLGL